MAEKDKNQNGFIMNGKQIHYSELPSYDINRQVLFQEDANNLSGYEIQETDVVEQTKKSCGNIKLSKCLKQTIPVVEWLPKYSVRKNLVGDTTSGLTVAVMHIPQGMAYGLLAGVSPSVGLYTAFFPTLTYFLFGTSRHISMGTFAVISIMVSKIVGTYSNSGSFESLTNSTVDGLLNSGEPIYTPIQVVTAVSFVVGIFHMIMCFLRLGMMASLLSEPLVNGFTTAAAVHVFISQTKDLLGIDIPRHKGAFKIIYTVYDIFSEIKNSNNTALLMSVIIVIFMIMMNEFFKPWMSKRSKVPIPSELIAVVGGTVASYFLNLGPKFNVKLVGNIPVGLPAPEFPPISLFRLVAVDSIAVAIVSYSVVMSMGLIFAKKLQYEIRANQELLALGLANIVGSLFSCIPLSCSLSRSLIQEQTGGKTQIASVISAAIILVLLLWVGPYFESLPRCVLAGIIIVALKGMFMQATQLKRFYNEGKMEALVWVATFFSVVLIDIDIGLLIGVVLSLLALYLKGWKSRSCLLGQINETGIYVDLKYHKNAYEIVKTKIFRYTGSINFATRADFKKSLYDKVAITVRILRRASLVRATNTKTEASGLQGTRTVILDLSCVAHIDSAGCKTLSEIQKELHILNVMFLLAAPADSAYKTLSHSVILGEGPFHIFPTIHDAVLFSQGPFHIFPTIHDAVLFSQGREKEDV